MAMEKTDANASADGAARHALASLPQAVFHDILASVVPRDARHTASMFDQPRYNQGSSLHVPKNWEPLMLVSHDWCRQVQHVHARRALQSLHVAGSSGATRSGVLLQREQLILRRALTRHLELTCDMVHAGRPELLAQWGVLFSHAPFIEKLDLHRLSLRADCSNAIAIVDAAVTHCAFITSLEMPSLAPHHATVTVPSIGLELLLSAVRRGMQRWQMSRSPRHGKTGGLRALSMPDLPQTPSRTAAATLFVEDILRYCPHVEVLGNELTLTGGHHMGYLINHGQWFISETLWERFCQTCVQLTAFDWVMVPYATRFFEIFGRYVKPKLTRLSIGTAMNWDWSQYQSEMAISADEASQRGFAGSAHHVEQVLRACPTLKKLDIMLYHPDDALGQEEDFDDDEDMPYGFGFGAVGGGMGYAGTRDRVNIPHQKMMDQDDFGDAFCQALAQYCPRLEQFRISDVVDGSQYAPPIMTLTNQGLQALATLPYLGYVELKAVNVTGAGLYALINKFPSGFSAQREYEITVGSEPRYKPTEMAFYRSVEAFLKKLNKQKGPLPCAKRRVVLRLKNAKLSAVGRAWSESYMSRLQRVIRSVRGKYPMVRLRLVGRGVDKKGFSDLFEFGFYTACSMPNEWYGWSDDPQDTKIDSVFRSRGQLYDSAEDEYEDEYDDYGDYLDYDDFFEEYGMNGDDDWGYTHSFMDYYNGLDPDDMDIHGGGD